VSTVKAVVFDLDGVLIDSEGMWDQIRRCVAAEGGRPWPDDATHLMQGMSTAEWSAYLTDVVGVPGSPPQVAQAVIDRMADRYADGLPLLPGAVAVVRRIGRRWPLGLASSSPQRLIDTVLDVAGLSDAFAVAMSTERVDAGKPSPAVYLAVADRLGVEATTAVAVEDSSNGLRSAAAAGMGVIAVPRPEFPPAQDALALAHVVVDDVDAVTPDLVESLAGR
jgi:HAD superfamily hydrolase (TIGR01509 family)